MADLKFEKKNREKVLGKMSFYSGKIIYFPFITLTVFVQYAVTQLLGKE